jgi:hypothetical protein
MVIKRRSRYKLNVVPQFLRINAVTRAKRDEVIERVRAAITLGGGWIVDFKLFSNVSVCFNFEIPGNHIERLRESLAATGLHLSEEGHDAFAVPYERDRSNLGGSRVSDISGTLQITFIHNDPDLRIEVPKIPG